MEGTAVKYAGYVLMEDGLLLLFEGLDENCSVLPIAYTAYENGVRSIRLGETEAFVPPQVFKFLLEHPRIYVGTVAGSKGILTGAVLFSLDNLNTEAIFEVL